MEEIAWTREAKETEASDEEEEYEAKGIETEQVIDFMEEVVPMNEWVITRCTGKAMESTLLLRLIDIQKPRKAHIRALSFFV